MNKKLRRHKPLKRNIFLTVFGVYMGLGIFEAGLRFFPIKNVINFGNIYRPSRFPHISEHIPKSQGIMSNAPVEINSLGLRDREYSVKKPPGTTRIIILGDSLTFGQGVRVEETYPKRLEELLTKRHPRKKFEVFNTGVCGYNTLAEYLMLKEKWVAFHPDIVMVGFVLNDAENMKKLYDYQVMTERNKIHSPDMNYLITHVRTFALLHTGYEILHHFLTGFKDVSYYGFNYNRLYDEGKPDWAVCKKAMEGIRELGKRYSLKVVLVIIPDLNFPFPYYYRYSSLHSLIGETCRRLRIPYLDLLPLFSQTGYSFRKLILATPGEGHPSALAYRLMAEWMYDFIARGEYVQGSK